MSAQGMCFTTADGGEVPNEGEQTLPSFSENLVRTNQRWQLADVASPLLSVGEECDLGQWCVFTSTGGFIHNPTTRETRFMRRDEKTDWGYEMNMWVPPAPTAKTTAATTPGFPGQGKV